MQKKSALFFSFPSANTFGEAKGTKNRAQNKKNLFFFYAEMPYLRRISGKGTKKREKCKRKARFLKNSREKIFCGGLP